MPTSPTEQAQRIRDAAIAWFVRRDTGRQSAADEAAFRAWLAADPAHAGAYADTEGLWTDLGKVRQRVPVPACRAAARRRPAWRIAAWSTAVAATVALLVTGFDMPMRLAADMRTGVGEIRTLTLADGSEVVLGTASAVAVDYGPQARQVRLLRGEAIFKVVADPQGRPFDVIAHDGRERALGTEFLVRLQDSGADVTALVHRISVTYPAPDGPAVILSPGEQVGYAAGSGLGHIARADPGTGAWARGKLMFTDAALGDVVAELNRYFAGRIMITDDTAAARRVSGTFDINDPLAALTAIERILGLRSTRLGGLVVLLHR